MDPRRVQPCAMSSARGVNHHLDVCSKYPSQPAPSVSMLEHHSGTTSAMWHFLAANLPLADATSAHVHVFLGCALSRSERTALQVTADAEYNPDLLGAMRGAGSVFGVVTELTVQLYDVTDYVGGHLVLFDDESTSIHRHALTVSPLNINGKADLDAMSHSHCSGAARRLVKAA